MLEQINKIITAVQGAVWGLPLILLILFTGFLLTVRLGLLQVRHLGKAFKFMIKNEEEGHGEVTSFGALCTALSATIGTGNIAGVATALAAGGPGALFWQSMQKDCWRSSTVLWTRKDTFSEDRSIILRMVWERNGNGWLRSLRFSARV